MDKAKEERLEMEKSKVHIIVAIIEYVPSAIMCRTIIKKPLAM